MIRLRQTSAVVISTLLLAGLLAACGGGGAPAGFTRLVPDPNGTTNFTGTLDDGYQQISFTQGFTFDFFGTTYNSVYINTNGGVTFGAGNSDYHIAANSPAQPGIAILWGDLDPSQGNTADQIDYQQYADHFVIRYTLLPDYGDNTLLNTMTLTLYTSGKVTMSYDRQDTTRAFVGVFDGTGTGYTHPALTSTYNNYSTGSGTIVFDADGSGPTLTKSQLNGMTITFNP